MNIDITKPNKASNLTIDELTSYYKEIFTSPQGQIILDDLILQTRYLNSNVFDNPNSMYFHEGKRDLLNYILSFLDLSCSPNSHTIEEK